MLSKNVAKYINSLQIKKFRQQHGQFVVEGAKSVFEVLASDYEVQTVISTPDFLEKNHEFLRAFAVQIEITTADELAKIGSFQTNETCLAVVSTKENVFLCAQGQELVLVLDDIRDPGNLGTILRVADWYGIKKVICSTTTTDLYNPKVIAASKGSFCRVQVYYCDLPAFFEANSCPIYGAVLAGQSVYETVFKQTASYLLLGNEANGVSQVLNQLISHPITIPRAGGAESLNVGIATAVLLDNWHRQMLALDR